MSARVIGIAVKIMALLGAWVFAIASILVVVRFGLLLRAHPSACASPMVWKGQVTWGLFYQGEGGFAHAMGDAALVAIVLAMSVLRSPIVRRIGLICVIGWAVLWTGNAWWFAITTPPRTFDAFAMLMTLFLACTIARAAIAWSKGRPKPPPTVEEASEE